MRDLTGQRFGNLVVIEQDRARTDGRIWWICVCDCGEVRSVRANSLLAGDSRSCGCLVVATNAALATHGHTRGNTPSPTYVTWRSMIARCTDEDSDGYPAYGGAGVAICERWMSFDNFLEDMGERPNGATIDRYPNKTGHYEPGNTRWATSCEQAENRRTTILTRDLVNEIRGRIEHGERKHSIAKRMGLTWGHVHRVVTGKIWKNVDPVMGTT